MEVGCSGVHDRRAHGLCHIGVHSTHEVQLFDGAQLDDPAHLFNSGLESKRARSINLADGETIDTAQLKRLVKSAFAAT